MYVSQRSFAGIRGGRVSLGEAHHLSLYLFIYIYREREKERDSERGYEPHRGRPAPRESQRKSADLLLHLHKRHHLYSSWGVKFCGEADGAILWREG